MKITRINPPKYKFGRYKLNEYELRQFQLEVAKGEKSNVGVIIIDELGISATILDNGKLSNKLHGMDLSYQIVVDMMSIEDIKE